MMMNIHHHGDVTLLSHLDLDGERVDEVFWNAVGVPSSIDTHGDELALQVKIRLYSRTYNLKYSLY